MVSSWLTTEIICNFNSLSKRHGGIMGVQTRNKIKGHIVGFLKATEVSNLLVFLAIVLISSIAFMVKSNNSALIGALNIVFSYQLIFTLGAALLRIILEYVWERRFFGFPVGN